MRNFSLAPVAGTIQGHVTNTAGAALAGATVVLSSGATTTTNPTGAYAFAAVPPGTYGISVSAATYVPASATGIVLVNAGTAGKDFVLAPQPGALQGTVKGFDGTVISNATVLLTNGASTTTNASGHTVSHR